jgi:hypothetical protein
MDRYSLERALRAAGHEPLELADENGCLVALAFGARVLGLGLQNFTSKATMHLDLPLEDPEGKSGYRLALLHF